MCSNFQPIKSDHAPWVKENFDCDLPAEPWRPDVHPTHLAPFVYLEDGKPKCELAQFGMVPHCAKDKMRYGRRTYNARSETVHEKPTFQSAWKNSRFGLVLMESFYEPNWETKKSVKWEIERTDGEPCAAASIWERIVDKETGEVIFSFSMLTINADGHEIMKHFHKPEKEKRSIVVLEDKDYLRWLGADHDEARGMLKLAADGFLTSQPDPR